MNIFKILASGDGSINEPNVSAFLGYLINPKYDHGIGDELLRKLLSNLYDNNNQSSLKDFLVDRDGNLRNLSTHSNFEIEVLLEQAFKIDGVQKKEIVDIVILCFEKRVEKKESLAKAILSDNNKGELKQIFLIENKIKDNAAREGQLIDQAKSSIDTLAKLLNKSEVEIKKMISIIFISPYGEKSSLQYELLKNNPEINIPKTHINWADDNQDNPSIFDYLKQILLDEAEGDIEAINEYTKYTIKSFMNFIQNDFKSIIEEKLEGETIRDIDYDFEDFKTKNIDKFNEVSWCKLAEIDTNLREKYKGEINVRHSNTHPISVFIKGDLPRRVGKKIFSLKINNDSIAIDLIQSNYQNGQLSEDEKNNLLDVVENSSFVVSNENERNILIKSKNYNLIKILTVFEIQYQLAIGN